MAFTDIGILFVRTLLHLALRVQNLAILC